MDIQRITKKHLNWRREDRNVADRRSHIVRNEHINGITFELFFLSQHKSENRMGIW